MSDTYAPGDPLCVLRTGDVVRVISDAGAPEGGHAWAAEREREAARSAVRMLRALPADEP